MAFVEPGPDGRYPERRETTSRAWLEDIWRRLVECEATHDPVAMNRARREAASALDRSVGLAVERTGMTVVGALMQDVDFRGW